MDQKILEWFRHMEKMDERRLIKRIQQSRGVWNRGRSRAKRMIGNQDRIACGEW